MPGRVEREPAPVSSGAARDGRGRSRSEQDGQPFLAATCRIGAAQQEAVVGNVAVGDPDLVSSHHETITVGNSRTFQRGKIRARVRLAEPLRPHHLPSSELWQEVRFVLVGAELDQRRTEPVHVHVLRTARFVVRPVLFLQDRLQPDAGVLTAVRRRPSHGQPATLAELTADVEAELPPLVAFDEDPLPIVRQTFVQELAQLGPECLLLV